MKKETIESLESVLKTARTLLIEKYRGRKRLNRNEVWEQAVLLRDIVELEDWLRETQEN